MTSRIVATQGGSAAAAIRVNRPTSAVTQATGSATTTSTTYRTVATAQGAQQQASIVIKQPLPGETLLQNLKNVNATNIQDGYTLVWDAGANEFVTQPVQIDVATIDGGTY